MTAHTPTEWKWDGDTFVYALNLEGSNRFFCGIQPGWATQGRTRTEHEELVANARLIAAAPDLFGCLTMGSQLNTPDMLDWIADRLVAVHGENPHVDFVVSLRDRANAMRAAIAKAKGESDGR